MGAFDYQVPKFKLFDDPEGLTNADPSSLLSGGSSLLGVLSYVMNWNTNQEKKGLDFKTQMSAFDSAIGQAGIGMKEAEASIGSYESFLSRYPEYAQLQEDSYAAQGEQQLRPLLQNLGLANVGGAYRGFKAGKTSTAQTIAGQARKDVVTFAGADLALGGTGANAGLYERGLSELSANLGAERQTAQNQLDIWHMSLDALQQQYGSLQKARIDFAALNPDNPDWKKGLDAASGGKWDPFGADRWGGA